MKKRLRQPLNYRFHDPNSPEETAAFLINLFVEVNKPKVEAAIRKAADASAALTDSNAEPTRADQKTNS